MHTTWPSGHVLLLGSCFSLKPREVRVHSIFHSALNIIDEKRKLYTLVMHTEQLHPSSALVYFSDPYAGFEEFAFTKAQEGMFKENSLFFDCGIWVSCKGAKRVPSSEEVPPKISSIEVSYLREQMNILLAVQQEKQVALTVDSLFCPGRETTVFSSLVTFNAQLLKKSIQTHNIALARRGIEGLLGLGPGSTPSGDDFLCGFFMALHMCEPSFFGLALHTYLYAITSILSDFLRNTKPATTDISLQLLGLASKGLFSQPLIAIAKDFSRHVADKASWEAIADFGHSSGLDTGLGFLFAFSVLVSDFEYKGEIC